MWYSLWAKRKTPLKSVVLTQQRLPFDTFYKKCNVTDILDNIMYKIGGGWQYNVYDLGNGRVRKVEKTFFQKLCTEPTLYGFFRYLWINAVSIRDLDRVIKHSVENLRNNLATVDPALIGNPLFIGDHTYEQDKVISFGDMIKMSHDKASQRKLVESYMRNIIFCWQYGFSDMTFNFLSNNGVNSKGEVILIDLGELEWDKENVREFIRNKKWEHQNSFSHVDDPELKAYIQEQFDTMITLQNLERFWGEKVSEVSLKNFPVSCIFAESVEKPT